jgi:hypothetical protein
MMRKFSLGLSNPYLKIGVTLFLVGVAMIAGSSLLEMKASEAIAQAGFVLLGTGFVVYVIGRIAKAIRSLAS